MKKTQYFERQQSQNELGRLYIDFELGEDLYAIDMTHVSRVITKIDLIPVPCVPSFIAGLTLIENSVTTVVDLRSFLEIRGARVESKSLIEIKLEDQALAFLSDSIPGFLTLTNQVKRVDNERMSILLGTCDYRGRNVNILDAQQMLWILTGNFDRLPNQIGNVHGSNEPSDPWTASQGKTCHSCAGQGFLIVRGSQLFATVVRVYDDFQIRRRGNKLSFPAAADLVDIIERCFANRNPADEIHSQLSPTLPQDLFDEMLIQLEDNHVKPCPECQI